MSKVVVFDLAIWPVSFILGNMNNLILVASNNEIAEAYIKKLIEEKKDNYIIRHDTYPEKNGLTIEQLRDIVKKCSRSFKKNIFFIIWSFETAREAGQTTFLKTLEEHQKNIHFILVVRNSQLLLPTVTSRCHIVYLHQNTTTTPALDIVVQVLQQFKTNPSIPASTQLKLTPAKKKEQVNEFLNALFYYGYNTMGSEDNSSFLPHILKKALHAQRLIEHNFLDPETALDMVFR